MINISHKKTYIFLILLVTFLAGALGMFLMINYFPLQKIDSNKESSKVIEEKVTVTDEGISAAVKKIYDGVVVVETYKNNKHHSSGTGFVYKEAGEKAYILTNYHVIEGGDSVRVTFTNGHKAETEIIGSDAFADIAILSLAATEIISVIEVGSSEEAEVGDTVFAVGAPLDSIYSWTVTRGILSGKDRMVEVSTTSSGASDWVMKVLQTDAAINSGNSGGPLANSNGQVIGVTSLKLVSSGVEGMGFAIPIEEAITYANIIEQGNQVIRPFLGVSMIDVSYAANYGIIVPIGAESGVYVSSVDKNSPAAKAGLKEGDIIIQIGGTEVTSVAILRYNLYKYQSGDTVTISYYREADLRKATVKLVDSE